MVNLRAFSASVMVWIAAAAMGWEQEQSPASFQSAATEAVLPASEIATQQTGTPTVWRADEAPPPKGLYGKKIAIEASHGLTWYNNTWWFQREDWFPGQHRHSSQEDYNSARMVNRWLIPYLENAGASVYPDRCRDEQIHEVILDPAAAGAPHGVTGTWVSGSASDAQSGTYLRTTTVASSIPTATFGLHAAIPAAGYYGVTIWYPSVTGAATAASFTVIDAAGYRHPFRVNQSQDTARWIWLGRFYFEAGADVVVVEASNASTVGGELLLLDAVRLGGGLGSVDFGGGPSGHPRWEECAQNWTRFYGAPDWVWTSPLYYGQDYGVRFAFADWQDVDLFLRLHTNGSTYHTGYGSESYNYGRTSEELAKVGKIYPKIVQCIRTYYRSTWRDRGVMASTVRTGDAEPIHWVELAFHDYLSDTTALMDADFRRVAMRGWYEGTVEFFSDGSLVYLPEPPESVAVQNLGGGRLRVSWSPSAMGTAATRYRVYCSPHPYCYKDYAVVDAPATSVDIGPLTRNRAYYLQVRAANDGGISFPTETLAAFVPAKDNATRVLIVNGFDRFDWDVDELDNRRNYTAAHAQAICAAAPALYIPIQLDSASNEAVVNGGVALSSYRFVDWYLGEEGAAEETFSAEEQTLISQYRQGKGTLLVSGDNVAQDLDSLGSASDRAFLENALDAGCASGNVVERQVTAIAGGRFEGLDFALDDGSGDAYALLDPDALVVRGPGFATLRYPTSGAVAGIEYVEPSSEQAVFYLAFPFEAIQGPVERVEVMARVLETTLPPAAAHPRWLLYE